MWMSAQMYLWLSQVLKISLFADLRDVWCHFRCSQGQLILCMDYTWHQSRLKQQKKMWRFRASQVAPEPEWWHQNCTIHNRVNSRAVHPTESSKRSGRSVLFKACNTKLEDYSGIGEQWTSNKTHFHATDGVTPHY